MGDGGCHLLIEFIQTNSSLFTETPANYLGKKITRLGGGGVAKLSIHTCKSPQITGLKMYVNFFLSGKSTELLNDV